MVVISEVQADIVTVVVVAAVVVGAAVVVAVVVAAIVVHQQKAKLVSETTPHLLTSTRFPVVMKQAATAISEIKFLDALLLHCDDQWQHLICDISLPISRC